jgi:S-DNA-T family DNA segregation ATPase FtsK/SpoIIIE
MKVYLVDDIKVTKFDLPKTNDDFFTYNYSIINTNIKCPITFESKNDRWQLKSNGTVNIYKENEVCDAVEVVPYSSFRLKITDYNSIVTIYFTTDEKEQEYKLDLDGITTLNIGRNSNCNILYNRPDVALQHALITKIDNDWILSAVDDLKYAVYVSNYRVLRKKLKSGDTIFINGFKIIWMKDFIIINNPGDKIRVTGLKMYQDNNLSDNTSLEPVSDEDQNYKLYDENDYFYHIPRIREIIEDEEVTIEPPPPLKGDSKMPWYIRLLTRITLLSSSFYMIYNIVTRLQAGRSVMSVLPQIVMLVCLLIGTFIAPKLLDNYKKKQKKIYEKMRLEKYSQYLYEKEKNIILANKHALQVMNDNNLTAELCQNVIMQSGNRNFWSREIISNDFLTVRLGVGRLVSPIKVNVPEKRFELTTDDLTDKMYQIKEKYQYLEGAPITLSLAQKNISAFICDSQALNKYDYFSNIMVQLVALQSSADLKIVIFTNEDNESKWEFAKFLPHCWNDDRTFRYFASTPEEAKTVSSKLEETLRARKEKVKEGRSSDKVSYTMFPTYYLIICDNYKNTLRLPILDDVIKSSNNYGFGLTILTNTLKNLPVQCDTFVEIGAKDGCILARDIVSKRTPRFIVEYSNKVDLRDVSNKLLNIPIAPLDGLYSLPQSISFLDIYGVSKIEQLDILNRWKENNPVLSLTAPIGVSETGDIFQLDLHEKYHGPHGLVAGTTGSGKSEFLITYILSMCCNYHPYEVQFVLIDYKGGGLAGAFENRELGSKIPHLAGTITNLDTASMNRTLVSIQSELKRRQNIFNKTRDALGEGVIDIYKYQRFYREGIVKDPLPHLIIISDEFAELKAQQPDFMQELISTARIGRSLGVHLILATQKPSGVVNDQIWSNSRFKICLKVQDKSDSNEVLKRPDAAYLKEAGRFYLQVGNDELFEKGQAGWAGAKYIPSDKIVKKIDDSINFVNNNGEVIKSIKDLVVVEKKEKYNEQLTSLVKYIIELSKKENIKSKTLWLDPIPEEIFIKNLRNKYNYSSKPYIINPVIGEFDSPATQTQYMLTYNFNNEGNLLIVGRQGSGKENLISTLIISTIIDHTPEEVNFYIIDCGSESLRMFNNMPHVGEIAYSDDSETIVDIVDMLYKEIDKRKDVLSEFGGDYKEFISQSDNKLPSIIVVINNYDSFQENYNKLTDSLLALFREGPRYGIYFVVSEVSANTVRGKFIQTFTNKFMLELNDTSQYRTEFGVPRGLLPTSCFGRGIATVGTGFYEFQTALPCPKPEIPKLVREFSKKCNEKFKERAKKIPKIPAVTYDTNLYTELKDLSKVPVGYDLISKEPISYDFNKNKYNLISCNGINELNMSFIYALIRMLSKIDKTNVKVIDFVGAIKTNFNNVELYNKDLTNNLININNEMIKNKDNTDNNVYIFLGIGGYRTQLDSNYSLLLNKILERANAINNTKIIFIDMSESLKNIMNEEWFIKYVNTNSGIWLDPDANSQIIIKTNPMSLDDRRINFPAIGFIIENKNCRIIKHMIYNSNKEGDSNNG